MYNIDRVLSQVDHIFSICAEGRMSNDIFYKELGAVIILATHAAWKATHAAQEVVF